MNGFVISKNGSYTFGNITNEEKERAIENGYQMPELEIPRNFKAESHPHVAYNKKLCPVDLSPIPKPGKDGVNGNFGYYLPLRVMPPYDYVCIILIFVWVVKFP